MCMCMYIYTHIRHVAGITAGGPVVLSAIVFVHASGAWQCLSITWIDLLRFSVTSMYIHTFVSTHVSCLPVVIPIELPPAKSLVKSNAHTTHFFSLLPPAPPSPTPPTPPPLPPLLLLPFFVVWVVPRVRSSKVPNSIIRIESRIEAQRDGMQWIILP